VSEQEFKYKNADLLNRLHEMQESPYYAVAINTLRDAEMIISEQEHRAAELQALNAQLWEALKSSLESMVIMTDIFLPQQTKHAPP